MTGLRIAVVGAGPAGMYAIGYLLDHGGPDVVIDLYERLATPWGLVRSGVAPDHPEKKLVADRLFDFSLHDSRVRFRIPPRIHGHCPSRNPLGGPCRRADETGPGTADDSAFSRLLPQSATAHSRAGDHSSI